MDSQQKCQSIGTLLTLTLVARNSAPAAADWRGGRAPEVSFTSERMGIAMSFPAVRNSSIFFLVKVGAILRIRRG